ncbi:two-component sensor histidine kinase [Streptomyces minutiscleroticus]|uniref:histidine kinase n=1 Tax=Streptomyces minutiscleroticus TaxID=68238 RepID=A0A918NI75_9ACTN|nr:HAMP domain-containing sensor histidine kinase [Streptomyces minutiscleroticus]GGX69399.1 two-component sensor histidine kinase [Streptomyces minutiscleroticus]
MKRYAHAPRRLLARMSLRGRLLCLSIALVLVGLVSSGVVMSMSLHGYLEDRTDERLLLTGQVAARLSPPSVASDASRSLRAIGLGGDTVVTYVDDTGAVRRTFDASTAPPGGGPDLPALDRDAVVARQGRPFTVPAHDSGHQWRIVALVQPDQRLMPASDAEEPGSVIVATSLDDVAGIMRKTRNVSTAAGLVLLGVLTVAGWFAVRSGLRPLTRIEETTSAITEGSFSHRVPELAGPRTEVGRLTACLNEMLAQIDTAFTARAEAEARMRRFFADASHELRTPLAGIKGYTDLYRMGALPERRDVDHTMTRIAAESERLTRLVESMLLLARLDEDAHRPADSDADLAFPLDAAPMDLRTLAADALRDVRALDAGRPVTLTGPGGGRPAGAPALADEARLRQVVTNLVGNAVTHTPPGTPVRIGVGVIDGHAVLEVADHGSGLPPEEHALVFDRFHRADAARTHHPDSGSGLGLSIARSLTEAQGGRLALIPTPGGGCTFRVLLPVHHT